MSCGYCTSLNLSTPCPVCTVKATSTAPIRSAKGRRAAKATRPATVARSGLARAVQTLNLNAQATRARVATIAAQQVAPGVVAFAPPLPAALQKTPGVDRAKFEAKQAHLDRARWEAVKRDLLDAIADKARALTARAGGNKLAPEVVALRAQWYEVRDSVYQAPAPVQGPVPLVHDHFDTVAPKAPHFVHPADSRAGRVERGAWCLREGERSGLEVGATLDYLTKRGLTADETTEALDIAGGGSLVATALPEVEVKRGPDLDLSDPAHNLALVHRDLGLSPDLPFGTDDLPPPTMDLAAFGAPHPAPVHCGPPSDGPLKRGDWAELYRRERAGMISELDAKRIGAEWAGEFRPASGGPMN